MSNKKRRTGRPSMYPPEFQRDAVAMVLDEGRSIADVGRSLAVNAGTLGNWVASVRGERDAGRAVTPDERAENVELRAENAQLRMERDLLKRSLAFWSATHS
jgi:transposase